MPNLGSGRFEPTLETQAKHAQMCRDRATGMSYRAIAAKHGCTVSVAYKGIQSALKAVPVEAVDELRRIEAQRLDEITEELWVIYRKRHPYISQGRVFEDIEDDGPRLTALSGLMKVMERRARLLGLDAPAKQTVTVITEDVIDQQIAELTAQVAELEASAHPDA